ncbi:hypothetical protein AB0V79_27695 [Mesorhizobium ciceri]|uniref:hypothetical protein n=1 Tax=Mesorhizobium TaxID=68287 RepID=UPI0007A94357|nr:hypothetical protein [Mesorhizobium ciceri]AMX98960.1 hypothetical protein A4R29_05275 [Mesorhizobium ciceri biovar biserrulae]
MRRAAEALHAPVAARWDAQHRGDEIHLVHGSDLYSDGPPPKETDILLEGVAVHGELKAWLRRKAQCG